MDTFLRTTIRERDYLERALADAERLVAGYRAELARRGISTDIVRDPASTTEKELAKRVARLERQLATRPGEHDPAPRPPPGPAAPTLRHAPAPAPAPAPGRDEAARRRRAAIQDNILAYLQRQGGEASGSDVAGYLGIDQYPRQDALQSLILAGRILAIGSARGRRYRLVRQK